MGTTRPMERPIGRVSGDIPRRIVKMGGLSHLLRLDPKKIKTDDEFNAALDSISATILGRKIETAEPVTEEPVQEESKERKKKTGQDREHKGGQDREA